jgi:hypothetical protein
METQEQEYAAYGTACHFLAERCIKTDNTPFHFLGEDIATRSHSFTIDEEMCELVDQYVSYVTARTSLVAKAEIDPKGESSFFVLEQKFKLDKIQNLYDAGGTADCIIYDRIDKLLEIVDFKSGRVFVDAEDNPQLLTYALGFVSNHKELPVKMIRLTIVQPRSGNGKSAIRHHDISLKYLIDWARNLVKIMEKTKRAEYDFATIPRHVWAEKYLETGEHCTYCPANADCPALKKSVFTALEVREEDEKFKIAKAIDDMTEEEISRYLSLLPLIEIWIKNIRAKAMWLSDKGVKIPDYVLQETRGREIWSDDVIQDDIAKVALSAGVEYEKVYNVKIRTPTQIKKELVKLNLMETAKMLENFVIRKSSGKKLVHVSEADASKKAKSMTEQFFTRIL